MEQNKQDILNKKETEKMCLSGDCELGKMCSTEDFATCGDSSIAVKVTEVNSVNSLKIKHFRVFGQANLQKYYYISL